MTISSHVACSIIISPTNTTPVSEAFGYQVLSGGECDLMYALCQAANVSNTGYMDYSFCGHTPFSVAGRSQRDRNGMVTLSRTLSAPSSIIAQVLSLK
jgi:hypothetical protein